MIATVSGGFQGISFRHPHRFGDGCGSNCALAGPVKRGMLGVNIRAGDVISPMRLVSKPQGALVAGVTKAIRPRRLDEGGD